MNRLSGSRVAKHSTKQMSKWTHVLAAGVISLTLVLALGSPIDLALSDNSDIAEEYVEIILPLPKPDEEAPAEVAQTASKEDWRSVTVRAGDNLSQIFARFDLPTRQMYQLLQSCKEAKSLETLHPGQVIKVRLNQQDDQPVLQELIFQTSKLDGLHIVREKEDVFKAAPLQKQIEIRSAFAVGLVGNTLYGSAKKAGLSDKLILRLGDIFGWKLDLSHDISSGDAFLVIYEQEYIDGEKVRDGDILAAELMNRGKTYRALAFRDEKRQLRYYTPEGQSLKQAFMRNPVHFSRISSHFTSSRWHPVLGVKRPHRGVDYAAPRGTPIKASGDGIVEFKGRKSGYGNTVIINHGRGYTTLYAHMSRFKKGLRKGAKVAQGNVIGYVGRTGLATGPHLHYEFRINGVHKNPITVTLPGKSLNGIRLRTFQGQVAGLVEQLDVHKSVLLAKIATP